MTEYSINFWAVLVAGVVYMILGAVWYSPALFGNSWMKLIGKTKEQVSADFSPVNYLIALVTSLLAAYGIARVMFWAGSTDIMGGVMISLVAGICFVLTTMSVNDTFEKKPAGLTFINVLYHLVSFIIMGVILGAWR